jgi:16S rRNA (uracil1498-N3)-methyltransferase
VGAKVAEAVSTKPMPTSPLFLVAPDALKGIAVGDLLTVDGDEGRHAVTVRRLRAGEIVHVGDGVGTIVEAKVTSVSGRDCLQCAVDVIRHSPLTDQPITVVQAVIKGDRGELAVEMLTEVGVDRVIPWNAQRGVARWAVGDRGVDRWRRTAREAAKQARRAFVPDVTDVMGTDEICHVISSAQEALVLHESASEVLTSSLGPAVPTVLVIGPEGGLTDSELTQFAEAGARLVRLGPTVLRASTAGTVAAAVVMSATGRWVAGSDEAGRGHGGNRG